MSAWRYGAGGVLLTVRVTPRGGRDAIDGVETLANGRSVLKLRVRAIAEGGEANRAVIEVLAAALKVPKAQIRLASGVASRVKQIEIAGDGRAIGAALQALVDA